MATTSQTTPVYSFKESQYSSHSALLQALPEQGNGLRVLDLGCADGYIASRFASRGYDVTGVERPEGVTNNFPSSVKLVCGDLELGIPPLAGKFDFIICADILEHLRNPKALLDQAAALLSPRGQIIASLPNSGNIYFRLVILSGRFPQEDKGLFDKTHVRFYTYDGWRSLFESAGLSWAKEVASGIPVGLAFPEHQGSAPVTIAEKLSYTLARLWKRLFAYQFIVVARKEGA